MTRIKLVGMGFQKWTQEPEEGSIIKLVREPNNEFDVNAIAVMNQKGEKIAYVGTNKTVTRGNRERGCVSNDEIVELINDDTKGVITKYRNYFGFAEVDL